MSLLSTNFEPVNVLDVEDESKQYGGLCNVFKHKDLILIPNTHIKTMKMPGIVTHICNSSAVCVAG